MDSAQEVKPVVESQSEDNKATQYSCAMEQLVTVVQELSLARDLETVMRIVRQAARELTNADGSSFVLRDNGMCYYADESAITPLWKGQRFPMNICIGGWTMFNRQPVVIKDIYADARIPYEAYKPTFVKSLVMVPIRTLDPIGAIGNYWAEQHQPTSQEVKLLQALADITAVALENIQIYAELEQRVQERTAQLETAYTELATLADNVPVLVSRFDSNLRYVFVNQKYAEICGISKDAFLGKTQKELNLLSEKSQLWEPSIHEVFATQTPKEIEFTLSSSFGLRHYCTRFVPEFDINGNVVTVLGVTHDVTERKVTEEESRRLSLTDDMTGLYNRRGFFLLAERELKVACHTFPHCALFYADLDGLKKINDTLGHDEGSAMIVDAAQLLKASFRDTDVVARLGGDEFIILVTNCCNNLDVIQARLQAKIDDFNRQQKRSYQLSMSVGILLFESKTSESLASLVAQADELMYTHKRAKRKFPEMPSNPIWQTAS